jgi:hypothetical protein
MPADTCEGKFASDLWAWITIDAVITFSPQAAPFPNIDAPPLVFFLRDAAPNAQFLWVECHRPSADALKKWVRSGFKDVSEQDLVVMVRDLKEGLTAERSREPFPDYNAGHV